MREMGVTRTTGDRRMPRPFGDPVTGTNPFVCVRPIGGDILWDAKSAPTRFPSSNHRSRQQARTHPNIIYYDDPIPELRNVVCVCVCVCVCVSVCVRGE